MGSSFNRLAENEGGWGRVFVLRFTLCWAIREVLYNGRLDGRHFTESYPSRAIAKPSSGLPREKRMNRKSSWINREQKSYNQNKPNTPNSPFPPIKDSGYMVQNLRWDSCWKCHSRNVATPSSPQNSLFYSDGISRTGLKCQQLLPGAHRAWLSPGLLACAFLSVCERLKPLMNGDYWDQWDHRLKALLVQAGASAQGWRETVLGAL